MLPGTAGEAMSDGAAMLGVERSLLGKRWRPRLADSRAGLSLAQAIEAPELIGRACSPPAASRRRARPTISSPRSAASCPIPLHLRDMEKAVARLARALDAGEKIAVFGDYDVDGATSAALLCRLLRGRGHGAHWSTSPTACARAMARMPPPCAMLAAAGRGRGPHGRLRNQPPSTRWPTAARCGARRDRRRPSPGRGAGCPRPAP